MDILNYIPQHKFEQIDDLLTFISIYDDTNRTKALFNLLQKHQKLIKNKICLEIGAGAGIISEKLALLGAKKVYAIEKNKYLYNLAKKRLQKYKNITVLNLDITQFFTTEKIDLVFQELFGQLLYDEDIYILQKLNFQFDYLIPNKAKLRAGIIDIEVFDDPFVNKDFIKYLDGVLVSGLFDETGLQLQFDVIEFDWNKKIIETETIVSVPEEGDLLYFGLELYDGEEIFCQAGKCPNWAFVWTYKSGKKFKLKFVPTDRGSEVYFQWLE